MVAVRSRLRGEEREAEKGPNFPPEGLSGPSHAPQNAHWPQSPGSLQRAVVVAAAPMRTALLTKAQRCGGAVAQLGAARKPQLGRRVALAPLDEFGSCIGPDTPLPEPVQPTRGACGRAPSVVHPAQRRPCRTRVSLELEKACRMLSSGRSVRAMTGAHMPPTCARRRPWPVPAPARLHSAPGGGSAPGGEGRCVGPACASLVDGTGAQRAQRCGSSSRRGGGVGAVQSG